MKKTNKVPAIKWDIIEINGKYRRNLGQISGDLAENQSEAILNAVAVGIYGGGEIVYSSLHPHRLFRKRHPGHCAYYKTQYVTLVLAGH